MKNKSKLLSCASAISSLSIFFLSGAFLSFPAYSQSGFSYPEALDEYITVTEVDFSDPTVAFNGKLESAFSHAYGTTTYTGNNRHVLSKLAIFTGSDIELIIDSQTSTAYIESTMRTLNEVCDYYDSTDYDDLDAEYLARAKSEAQEAELTDRSTFLVELFIQMSSAGQSEIERIMETVDLSRMTGTTTKVDYLYVAQTNPEQVKAGMSNSCANIRASTERRRRAGGNDRMGQVTTITLTSDDQ